MLNSKLIHAIKRENGKAFCALYEMYFPKVVNYAYKLLHSQEDAQEVAQDVFIKLWAKRYELDPNQSISGLIFRITKFLAIDLLRKKAGAIRITNVSAASEVGGRTLEHEYLDGELQSVYLGSVKRLPRKRRLIFQLSRNRDLSYKEISVKLNISTKTVEAQMRLALQQIREDISKYSLWCYWPLFIISPEVIF